MIGESCLRFLVVILRAVCMNKGPVPLNNNLAKQNKKRDRKRVNGERGGAFRNRVINLWGHSFSERRNFFSQGKNL